MISGIGGQSGEAGVVSKVVRPIFEERSGWRNRRRVPFVRVLAARSATGSGVACGIAPCSRESHASPTVGGEGALAVACADAGLASWALKTSGQPVTKPRTREMNRMRCNDRTSSESDQVVPACLDCFSLMVLPSPSNRARSCLSRCQPLLG